MSNVSDLDIKLNSQQKAAVFHDKGPAIVLAGAGSGKTRVLTARSAWLLQNQQLSPEQILLLTFTNKAAQEMNQRVYQLTQQKLPFSGTFHRFCALILRSHGQKIGLANNYVIYDSQDQDSLIRQIYQDKGFDHKKYNRNAVKAVISNAKNDLISFSQLADRAESDFESHVALVYKIYQQRLKQNQAVDFDDLLVKTINLFQQDPSTLNRYQEQFIHVLVDEYQDTNKAQYLLTKLLSQPQNNAYVVGDFSQSIYAWRGADYRNLEYFKQDFPQISEYRLEQNYRSTQTILDAATQVISQNSSHPVLKLWTEQTDDQPVEVLETEDNEDEALTVLTEIRQLLTTHQPQDIAILYRVNAQSRAFEEAFVRHGLAYQLIGGFKFYERQEIKDVLAYLRLILNPADEIALERVTKIGKRRLAQFQKWRQKQTGELAPYEALVGILKNTKYSEKYDDQDPQDLSRLENIEELVNVASKFNRLDQFLENVALVQDNEFADVASTHQKTGITMMSLHSAKGLEFPIIFMVGMEEGLLPHSRSLYDPDQLEEERRLCYVGMTRAKKRLYLSYAQKRWQYGTTLPRLKSRFISEIKPNLLKYKNKKGTSQQIVIDDDILDSVLNDEMDLDSFLDS